MCVGFCEFFEVWGGGGDDLFEHLHSAAWCIHRGLIVVYTGINVRIALCVHKGNTNVYTHIRVPWEKHLNITFNPSGGGAPLYTHIQVLFEVSRLQNK